jgi:hypothetical protein
MSSARLLAARCIALSAGSGVLETHLMLGNQLTLQVVRAILSAQSELGDHFRELPGFVS